MYDVLIILGAAWLIMQLTFVFYLAIMNAIANKKDVAWPAWVFIAPMVIVGVSLDVTLNILVGTVMFLDLPREFLFTKRLKSYRQLPIATLSGMALYRGKLASFWCEKILNAFDPTKCHC